MKRKITVASLVALSLLLISGCSQEKNEVIDKKGDFSSFANSSAETTDSTGDLSSFLNSSAETTDSNSSGYIEERKYFDVLDISKGNEIKYKYNIYDKDHKVLDSGVAENNNPKISYIGDDVIKIEIGVGTGLVNSRYYKISGKLKSDWFMTPIAENNEMVVYLDYTVGTTKVIVQNIFDKSIYYKEFKRDFFATGMLPEAKFISNKQLSITYQTGEDGHEVTEKLDL